MLYGLATSLRDPSHWTDGNEFMFIQRTRAGEIGAGACMGTGMTHQFVQTPAGVCYVLRLVFRHVRRRRRRLRLRAGAAKSVQGGVLLPRPRSKQLITRLSLTENARTGGPCLPMESAGSLATTRRGADGQWPRVPAARARFYPI